MYRIRVSGTAQGDIRRILHHLESEFPASTVDLEPYLEGPVFEPVRNDRELFEFVRVDPEEVS